MIRADLGDASDNLTYTTNQFGRWTKGAVDHLRAKVEMWDNNYSEAASIVDEIIDEGPNSLVDVADVFSGEMTHSETLFAINFEKNAIGGGAWHQMNWQTVAHYSAVPGLKQTVENGGAGFGFMTLNPYAVDLINENPEDQRKENYYIFNYMTSTKVTTTRKSPRFKSTKKIPLLQRSNGISYFNVAVAVRTTSFKTASSVRSTFLYASKPQMFLA